MKKILTIILAITLSTILLTQSVFARDSKLTLVEGNNKQNEALKAEPNNIIIPMAQYGEITGNNVRLRSEPGLSSTVLMFLQMGYEVTLPYVDEEYKDGYYWTNVIYNGVNGWVASQYVYEYGR